MSAWGGKKNANLETTPKKKEAFPKNRRGGKFLNSCLVETPKYLRLTDYMKKKKNIANISGNKRQRC